MKKLLLVDGHNLLFRMVCGMPFPFYDEKQRDITGTVGFISNVVKMIKYFSATHCLIVFDGENSLVRKDEHEEYKANRVIDFTCLSEHDNPFIQLDYIKQTLDYMKIKWVETDNCECDDYIAKICMDNQIDIVISSTDSDFFQLINERITVVNFKGKNTITYTPEKVKDKYGVEPKEFALFKAIVGDKSDNIAGVNKVGQKTAINIINSLNRNVLDKYYDIFRVNEALINHNLNLIRLPRNGVEVCSIDDCLVDCCGFKDFKSLQIINKALNEK